MIIFYRALKILFQLIEFLIIIRILMSFMNINPDNAIGQIVYELTDPVLAPAKGLLRMLPFNTGMLDFSPIVAMLLLRFILDIVEKLTY